MKRFTKLFISFLLVCLVLATSISLAGCVSSENLVIGDTIYGKTLLSVSTKGENKTKIRVPEGVEYIAQSAFSEAELTLTKVILPKSLKRIGYKAFASCKNLQEVELPKNNNLTIIDNEAFIGCKSLQKLTLSNPTEFGQSAFSSCPSLTLRLTSEELPVTTADLHANAIIAPASKIAEYKKLYASSADRIFADDKIVEENFVSEDGKTLDKYIGAALEVTVPASLSKIKSSAFNSTSIEKLNLPSSVTQVEPSAFNKLSNLKEINLSSSLTTIPSGCFYGLASLRIVNIPSDSKLTTIEESAFENCYFLNTITLPNSITKLGDSTFKACRSLKNTISLPNLTSMGEDAFAECENLAEVNFPKLTTISANAFKLSGITVVKTGRLTSIDTYAFGSCKKLTSIPDLSAVKTISDRAFIDCDKLSGAINLNSLVTINSKAFDGCSSLTQINNIRVLETIGSEAFANCTSVASIKLPSTVKSVGSEIFKNWTAFQKINVPSNFPTTVPSYNKPWNSNSNAEIIVYQI